MATDASTGAADDSAEAGPSILVESDVESDIGLREIPEASTVADADGSSKRQRESEESGESDDLSGIGDPVSKRTRLGDDLREDATMEDDKKLGITMRYEGFSIWGWVLCLLINRRDQRSETTQVGSQPSRQAVMEEWISTQMQREPDGD
jgi:hypothetical protein